MQQGTVHGWCQETQLAGQDSRGRAVEERTKYVITIVIAKGLAFLTEHTLNHFKDRDGRYGVIYVSWNKSTILQ